MKQEDDGEIVKRLRQIDRQVEVPPADPATEAALLAAFDAAWTLGAGGSRLGARGWGLGARGRGLRARGSGLRSRWVPIGVPLAAAAAIAWVWIETRGPGAGVGAPGTGLRDPGAGRRDPGAELRDPGAGIGASGSGVETPVAQGTSVAQGFNPASGGTGANAAPDTGEFVEWPGASALPAFESGELVRMTLSSSILPSLGLFPPASDATVVTADVLVGQDGLARAVRLVRVARSMD